MTFDAIDAWWWPFLFILLAGWLATDAWRFLGVAFGGRIREDSEALVFVRAVATALVAAVIGNLFVFPSGALADTTAALRIGAAALGFVAYLAAGKRMLLGIVVGEAALIAGMAAGW
ncbi:AzlD domain-containing protein [Kumtagia ephedrae]|jgi:branched-subunit amino acid transport protein|uniref:Branched-chain amino acid transport n=1 Tax=Kumtagia ephedrae TaxID=2116701 RepID=A0A2P7S079_9HYPH|nr:AzlD domain-containing protein [Mesorhizobium ephedrae]PSJ55888.1 branched-chain amino acid transport [Mesorhizobium ephedrae]